MQILNEVNNNPLVQTNKGSSMAYDLLSWLQNRRYPFPLRGDITQPLYDFINDNWQHRENVAFEYKRNSRGQLIPARVTMIRFSFKSAVNFQKL
jgi:hypothetical protein